MAFHLIDVSTWKRKDHYTHFIKEVVCTYSATIELDITKLKGQKLYPAMIWLLTRCVNQIPEFRTVLTEEGVGFYDDMHPAYTIFNKENQTFSGIWTEFHPQYTDFLSAYESDATHFSSSLQYAPKPHRPANSFDISMVPWFTFSSFNLNIFGDGKYLLPIFTLGKFFERDGRRLIPLAIQVHHAVCDGYHVGMLAEMLQKLIEQFPS